MCRPIPIRIRREVMRRTTLHRTEQAARQMLVLTRTFNAPRSLVFKAWTEPERVMRWWGPKDFTCPVCEIDLRPGGTYRNCMRSPEGKDFWSQGIYHEIKRAEPDCLQRRLRGRTRQRGVARAIRNEHRLANGGNHHGDPHRARRQDEAYPAGIGPSAAAPSTTCASRAGTKPWTNSRSTWPRKPANLRKRPRSRQG